jgi:hypothetical protein
MTKFWENRDACGREIVRENFGKREMMREK